MSRQLFARGLTTVRSFVPNSVPLLSSPQKLLTPSYNGSKIFIVPGHNNDGFYSSIKESYRKNNSWGMATSIDCSGCTDDIKDKNRLHKYVLDLCKLIDMKRFGDCQIVHFGEDKRVAGYSLVQLIETSCISGHFANDTNAAYIDIFSCKPYNPVDAVNFTKKYFGARDASATVVLRQ